MNRELERMRNNAEIVENSIEIMVALAKKYPESPADYGKIVKAQGNLLDAIHERICDLTIEENKKSFWKKLFRK